MHWLLLQLFCYNSALSQYSMGKSEKNKLWLKCLSEMTHAFCEAADVYKLFFVYIQI